MKLFKRRKKTAGRPAAEWLVRWRDWLEVRQRRFADGLGRRTQYWSRGSWLVALGLFILLFGGCCLLLCIRAFIHF